ncbi:hypothetical protein [Prosthecobacter vanneervenii]|uniref:Uncharacterized protein n=1 Tax=Prosthecobacter vanneervenii TaxID=48466 RepID=A0A7W8DLG3_9BACT|nr:hypothetical protein [Prosthecobacter vanneervenii]MBB5034127.1 hypothetical protein [Prosthecobacter vanneervenii]
MATLNPLKRRSMDAITHSETQAHMRLFCGTSATRVKAPAAAPSSPQSFAKGVKRLAMDAVSNVETVAQVGWVKLTGGVAVYSARIREMDRDAQRDDALRKYVKAQEKQSREHERE